MQSRKENNRSSYLDANDETSQSEDIQRLKVQSFRQNQETARFLQENIPADAVFSNVIIPFCGEGAEIEVLVPHLDNQSQVTVVDVSPVKVKASVEFAESLGIHSENITGIQDPSLEALKKLKEEGKKFDFAHIKLGLIWDPDYQETVEALSDVMEQGGVVVIEDIDPATMDIEPKSESLGVLSDAVVKWRESHGYENKIGNKLAGVCSKAGLKVGAVSDYVTQTQLGHPNHADVLGFFKVAGPRMIEEGFITREDFDLHTTTYASELENPDATASYPRMKQVFAVKR